MCSEDLHQEDVTKHPCVSEDVGATLFEGVVYPNHLNWDTDVEGFDTSTSSAPGPATTEHTAESCGKFLLLFLTTK